MRSALIYIISVVIDRVIDSIGYNIGYSLLEENRPYLDDGRSLVFNTDWLWLCRCLPDDSSPLLAADPCDLKSEEEKVYNILWNLVSLELAALDIFI